MPNGAVKEGISWETTPLDIAMSISRSLADEVVISKVQYTGEKYGVEDVYGAISCGGDDGMKASSSEGGELWDLNRPLIGNCSLSLLKFGDKESNMVFWHSSAHCLGSAMEKHYGCHLTIGPPVENGFYYDGYMGDYTIVESDFAPLSEIVSQITKEKQSFERLVVTKEEALELFQYNPFKVSLIQNKIPDGGYTTVYKNGEFIDLCRGPHVNSTGKIKAFEIIRSAATNWLGQVENDSLQRVQGISFPDKDKLKKWKQFQEEAKQRDHRRVGGIQELFFFHALSPGSCFFLPHGARIYNKLISFIKQEYWARGYTEVITPNQFNMKLWEISGHAEHYRENMFTFEVEGEEFGLKPMNCPGHCLMFDHRLRSYRELPIRFADFGGFFFNFFIICSLLYYDLYNIDLYILLKLRGIDN